MSTCTINHKHNPVYYYTGETSKLTEKDGGELFIRIFPSKLFDSTELELYYSFSFIPQDKTEKSLQTKSYVLTGLSKKGLNFNYQFDLSSEWNDGYWVKKEIFDKCTMVCLPSDPPQLTPKDYERDINRCIYTCTGKALDVADIGQLVVRLQPYNNRFLHVPDEPTVKCVLDSAILITDIAEGKISYKKDNVVKTLDAVDNCWMRVSHFFNMKPEEVGLIPVANPRKRRQELPRLQGDLRPRSFYSYPGERRILTKQDCGKEYVRIAPASVLNLLEFKTASYFNYIPALTEESINSQAVKLIEVDHFSMTVEESDGKKLLLLDMNDGFWLEKEAFKAHIKPNHLQPFTCLIPSNKSGKALTSDLIGKTIFRLQPAGKDSRFVPHKPTLDQILEKSILITDIDEDGMVSYWDLSRCKIGATIQREALSGDSWISISDYFSSRD